MSRGKTFPLASPETDGPIVKKSRKKVEPLSILSSSLPFPFLLSSFFLPNCLVQSQVGCPLLPHVTLLLAPWITLIILCIYLGFPSNRVLPHVSHGSHLSSCLTSSPLDTCLILSHSNAQSVPHYSRYLKKREISNVSEFDEIRRSI